MPLRKAMLLVPLLLSALTLGGCVTTGSLGTNTVPCEIDPAITWSHKDTTETARQIVGHNAVVKKLCPGVHGHLTIGGRRVQNYDVNFDLYSAIGEIRSDVKTLLK